MPRFVIRQRPCFTTQQPASMFRHWRSMLRQIHYLAFRDSPDVVQVQPSLSLFSIGVARRTRECIRNQSQCRNSPAYKYRKHFPIRQQLFQLVRPHHSLVSPPHEHPHRDHRSPRLLILPNRHKFCEVTPLRNARHCATSQSPPRRHPPHLPPPAAPPQPGCRSQ